MDALCLATPATDDAFYYAGLQLLHANNGTGGAEWPAFYARYTALFGSGSQRAKELDWRARFARFDAGLVRITHTSLHPLQHSTNTTTSHNCAANPRCQTCVSHHSLRHADVEGGCARVSEQHRL